MPTYVHIIRHGQAEHNVSDEGGNTRDPPLTLQGLAEADDLRRRFPYHDRVTHVVASPLRRTLQTCIRAIVPGAPDAPAGAPGARKVIGLPDAQEAGNLPCDMGSGKAVLEAEFGDLLDTSLMTEDWWFKGGGSPYEPTVAKLEARSRAARMALREMGSRRTGEGDPHIVLVAHGSINHFLTDQWHDIEPGRWTSWWTGEFRTFVFKDPSGQDPDAELVETDESWARRCGAEPRPTEEQAKAWRAAQYEFQAPYMADWNGDK